MRLLEVPFQGAGLRIEGYDADGVKVGAGAVDAVDVGCGIAGCEVKHAQLAIVTR